MQNYITKFKTTTIPFLKVTLISIFIFDFLYYILFILNPPAYAWKITNIVIPASFALVVQLAVLYKFIKKFVLAHNHHWFAVNFVSYILLCIPISLSLPLIKTLTTTVVTINDYTEIDPEAGNAAFVIKDFYIDTTMIGENSWISLERRKHRADYSKLNTVLAAPVTKEDINTTKAPKYWYCRQYYKDTKKVDVKPERFDNFRYNSLENFKEQNTFKKIKYLEKIPKKWISAEQLHAINDIKHSNNINDIIILEPHYTNLNEEAFKYTGYLCLALFGSTLIWSLFMWEAKIKKERKNKSLMKLPK